jgi:hypothetical protein
MMSVTHKLVGAAASEVPLDEIGGDGVGLDPPPLLPPADALQAGTLHQELDLAVPDRDAAADRELGVDSTGAVDPVALAVDLGDQIGQQRVPHRPLRRRPLAALVEASLGHAKDPTGHLDWEVLRGDHLDRRVPPFGLASSLGTSTARRANCNSVSSSAIRFFAAASSAFSDVVKPDWMPRFRRRHV